MVPQNKWGKPQEVGRCSIACVPITSFTGLCLIAHPALLLFPLTSRSLMLKNIGKHCKNIAKTLLDCTPALLFFQISLADADTPVHQMASFLVLHSMEKVSVCLFVWHHHYHPLFFFALCELSCVQIALQALPIYHAHLAGMKALFITHLIEIINYQVSYMSYQILKFKNDFKAGQWTSESSVKIPSPMNSRRQHLMHPCPIINVRCLKISQEYCIL